MAYKTLGVWDVVSHATFGEGQVTEIKDAKADICFRDGSRVILHAALSFVRSGSPKEFLPSRRKKTGGPAKYLAENRQGGN